MLLSSSSHVLFLPLKGAKVFSYFLKGKKWVGGGCFFFNFLIFKFKKLIIFLGVGLLFWNGQKNEKGKIEEMLRFV